MASSGFTPPPPGTPMCRYLSAYDSYGLLREPRPCKRGAVPGSDYCRRHGNMVARSPQVEVRRGGFCVWCGQPTRSYVVDRVTIALCLAHGKALARAIREGR